LPGFVEKYSAGLGQPDRPRGSVEPSNPQIRLSSLDLSGQRWLRQMKTLCRAPKIQLLGDGDKIT